MGRQTLSYIKTEEPLKHIAVIICSTSQNPVEEDECGMPDVLTYIIKPSSYQAYIAIANLLYACWTEQNEQGQKARNTDFSWPAWYKASKKNRKGSPFKTGRSSPSLKNVSPVSGYGVPCGMQQIFITVIQWDTRLPKRNSTPQKGHSLFLLTVLISPYIIPVNKPGYMATYLPAVLSCWQVYCCKYIFDTVDCGKYGFAKKYFVQILAKVKTACYVCTRYDVVLPTYPEKNTNKKSVPAPENFTCLYIFLTPFFSVLSHTSMGSQSY